MLNSNYGALASPYFLYGDTDLAAAITTSGQLAIRWVSKDIDAYLNKLLGTTDEMYVIYNDTDACYVELERVVKLFNKNGDKTTEDIVNMLDTFCAKRVEPIIEQSYDDMFKYTNSFEQNMVMSREIISSCLHPDCIIGTSSIESLYDKFSKRNHVNRCDVSGIELVDLRDDFVPLVVANKQTLENENSYDSVTHISRKMYSGDMYTFDIDGRCITVTENHLLAVDVDGVLTWTKAKDIVETDMLVIAE